MNLFPSENFKLITQLSKEEVLNKIQINTREEREFKSFSLKVGHNKPFEGEVLKDSFKLFRVLKYRNSFVPIIHGQIFSTNSGSEIKIFARMGKWQFVTFTIWTVLLGLASIVCLFLIIMEFIHSESQIWTFIAPAMFLIGYGYVRLSFYRESQMAKDKILEILNDKEIENIHV